jgi:hypothetical protein
MKTRNGFVSNSSSSSFIVAINKPKSKEEEMILSALKITMLAHKNNYCESILKDYVKQLEEIVSDDIINIEYGEKHLTMIRPFKDDDMCNYIYKTCNHNNSLNGIRWTCEEKGDEHNLNNHIDSLEKEIESYKNKIKKQEDKISTLKQLDPDTILIHFDKDISDTDFVKNSLLEGEKYSVIKIVDIDVG